MDMPAVGNKYGVSAISARTGTRNDNHWNSGSVRNAQIVSRKSHYHTGWSTSDYLGCNESFELKIIGVKHSLHGVTKQIRVLAVIKTETHFVQIRLQMLCANLDY